MEIKVKYQIGQDVWVIVDNKIQEVKIQEITATVSQSLNIEIMYATVRNGKRTYTQEYYLFKTKEELIKSL